MQFGALIAYAGGLQVSTVVMMNVINSGLSMLAGTVVIGQGMYFGGRLVYRAVSGTTGFVAEKINQLRDTKEMFHTTVTIDDEELVFLDHHDIIEIHVNDFSPEIFNNLPKGKVVHIIGNQ